MKCLQVRYAPDEEWQWFYGGIDGFFFVPGFNYELLVNRFPIENPPADGSSIGYSLVEVVSMTPAYTGEALPLVGTEWLLVSFGEEQIVQYDPQLTPVTALFADDGTVSGKGGCNQYTGTYTEADGTLTFGPLASTMMMCDDAAMAVETAYFAALDGTHDYTINGNMLQIVYAAGQLTYQGATVTE
jgi:heat shock protein HslJ